MCAKSLQLCLTLRPYVLESRPLCPWDSPGKDTGRLPCLPPGDLPDPGIEPMSLMSPELAGGFSTTSATWETLVLSVPASS